MPRTTETRSVRDRNVFHEANAKSRETGRLKAKADAQEELRQQQHEERIERLRLAGERAGNPVQVTEDEVRELLLEGSIEGVADYLKVTVGTLTRWARDPVRAAWWQELCYDRGIVSGFSGKDKAKDDTRDPQHKALDLKHSQWESERLAKPIYGAQQAPPAEPQSQNLPAELYLSTAIALATQAGLLGQIAALMPPAGSVVATQTARPSVRLPAAVDDDGGTWDEP